MSIVKMTRAADTIAVGVRHQALTAHALQCRRAAWLLLALTGGEVTEDIKDLLAEALGAEGAAVRLREADAA